MKTKGDGLIEYVLPLGLIGVVTATILFNDTFRQILQNHLIETLRGDKVQDTQLKIPTLGGPISPSRDVIVLTKDELTRSLTRSGLSNLQLTLADGTLISLPEFRNDVGDLIDTVGSDGGTKELALNLWQLADALEKAGKTEEANIVRQIATKGFVLSRQYGEFERRIENGTLTPEDADAKIFDGIHENELFIPNNNYDTKMLFYRDIEVGAPCPGERTLCQMVSMFQSARANQQLQDPAVKQVVQDAIKQMALITSKGYQYTYGTDGTRYNKDTRPKDFKAFLSDAFQKSMAQSVNICDAGKGNSGSGIICY